MVKKSKVAIERETKINEAIPASAIIKSIRQTSSPSVGSMGRADSYCLELVIQVAGQPQYDAKTWWLVYPLAIPQMKTGEQLPVRVDKRDRKVIYPGMENVEYDWRVAMGYIP